MAAQQDTSTLTGWFKWAYEPLDKSEVESGILIQQSPIFIWPGIYDGVHVHDTLALNLSKWGWLYGQFIAASVSTSYLPDPAIYVQPSVMPHRYGQPVQLMYMATRYDMIREGALADNLVYIDNHRWYDVPGRLENPYLQDTCFALVPIHQNVWGLELTLLLSDSLIFNNIGWDIDSFEIDAGDGLGWRTAWPDSLIAITYSAEGRKEIRIRVTQGTDTYLAQTYLLIKEYEIGGRGGDGMPYNTENPEIISLDGVALNIFSSCSDNKIRHPLIVVEGYPNFSKVDDELFGKILSKEGLNDWLNEQEYDIIWVDWLDNASSVETQANRLINVIDWVNQRKRTDGSNEPNVMIGASFGGLVGKYAMLHMHNILGRDSEVETFFTYDSPLKGANLPVGMQAFLRDLEKQIEGFGGSIAPLQQALVLLDGPAPKQMLLKRVELNWNGSEFDFQLSDGPFMALQNQIADMESIRSMDNICRFITLSNGADAGFTQVYLEPKQKILDFFLDLDEIPGVKVWGNEVPEWCYDVRIEAQAYSADNINTDIYSRRIWSINYCWGNQIKEQGSLVWNIDSPLGLDNAPGGWTNLGLDMLSNGVESMKPDIPYAKELTFSLLPAYSFIPTVSSLDMPLGTDRYTNTPSGGPSVLRWSVSTEATPLSWNENLSDFNQDHVSMDGRIAALLISELAPATVQDLVPPLLTGEIYNFGKTSPIQNEPISTPCTINENVILSNGAQIWINRLNKIGYISSSNPQNAAPQSFHVSVPGVSCAGDEEEVVVVIDDGGRIVIGEVQGITVNTGKLSFMPTSTVFVKNGGEIILTQSPQNNLILQGGQGTIFSGGKIDARWGSRIIIRNGSTLTVKSGGLLRLSQYSALEVEDGGKLILEPGAIVQLWDGQTPDGNASIHIQNGGELEWQGDIQFSGNGYFQFDQGHIFTLLNDFNLAGMGKDFRFIKLNNGANLEIMGLNMDLSNGAVEYESNTGIIQYNGAATINNMVFRSVPNGSTNANAVSLFYPQSVLIENSLFKKVVGVTTHSYQGTVNGYLIDKCRFDHNERGLIADASKFITVKNSQFTDCDNAMWLDGVTYFYGYNLSIKLIDYPSMSAPAVIINNTPFYRLHASLIDGYEQGIYMDESSSTINKSNIFLYNSSIRDCNDGIYVPNGGTGPDRGMVLMDCSSLHNNQFGINGKDVLLSIDAIINSGTHKNLGVTPNTFSNGQNMYNGDNILHICYDQRDESQVLARQNQWSSSNANGEPNPSIDFLIKKKLGPVGCFSNIQPNIPVIYQPVSIGAFYVCPEPPRLPEGPSGPQIPDPNITGTAPEDQCSFQYQGDGMLSVHDNYTKGMHHFYYEEFEEAFGWFQPVADIPNSSRNNLSGVCRKYIDESRIMVTALSALINGDQPNYNPDGINGSANIIDNPEKVQLSEVNDISIFPNPAKDNIVVQSNVEDGIIQVVHSTGQLMLQRPVSTGTTTINVETLNEGIYEVRIFSVDGHIIEHQRVMIQR